MKPKKTNGENTSDKNNLTWLMKVVRCVLFVLSKLSIGRHVQSLVGWLTKVSSRKAPKQKDHAVEHAEHNAMDLYAPLAMVLLFVLLFWKPCCKWSAGVAIYGMVEMFVCTLCVILVDNDFGDIPVASPYRSAILLGVGLLELMAGFAVLYLYTGAIAYTDCPDRIVECPFHALYFSVVTITTLGFGDISPCTDWGRGLVMIETLMGIILIVFVLTMFISKGVPADDKKQEKECEQRVSEQGRENHG